MKMKENMQINKELVIMHSISKLTSKGSEVSHIVQQKHSLALFLQTETVDIFTTQETYILYTCMNEIRIKSFWTIIRITNFKALNNKVFALD